MLLSNYQSSKISISLSCQSLCWLSGRILLSFNVSSLVATAVAHKRVNFIFGGEFPLFRGTTGTRIPFVSATGS